jgi:hypothetical protein
LPKIFQKNKNYYCKKWNTIQFAIKLWEIKLSYSYLKALIKCSQNHFWQF